MTARTVISLGLGALMLFTVGRATAQPADDPGRAEARKIGYAGVEAYQAGDFATAHDRLETAYQMLRVPSLGLWSARALTKLGKLVEAEARYLEVIRLPTSVGDEAIQEQARQDARNERAELSRRIPSLLVRVDGAPAAEVAVTVDGAPLTGSALGESHLVNPGRHRIEGVRGTVRTAAEVLTAEGEQKEAVLRFVAGGADASGTVTVDAGLTAPRTDAVSASGTKRTIGWATIAAGGAGIVVGTVTGLLAISKKGALDDAGCVSGDCPPAQRDAVDSYERMRLVSGVGLIAGVVLAGAGTYLLLTTPSNDGGAEHGATARKGRAPIANLRFAVVPGGTMLRGEF